MAMHAAPQDRCASPPAPARRGATAPALRLIGSPDADGSAKGIPHRAPGAALDWAVDFRCRGLPVNSSLESTHDLVERSRAGDEAARDRLVRRYLPILTRWAHGRLPRTARDLSETADLVQVTLMRAFSHLPSFQVQGQGAFFGYLRHVLNNLLRDELRRHGRRPLHDEIPVELPAGEPQPVEHAVTLETLRDYEAAMQRLDPEQRELLLMRIELGLDNDAIAELIGSPSANAARMRVARAMARLAELMSEHRSP
jgi:RNA polymerase sigma factor (sigma-70 family)